MTVNSVVFVAFEENENLGVRYMSAILLNAGFNVWIIDFRKEKEEILKEIIIRNPLLVGFSLIFEDHIYDFRELIGYLRGCGIKSHFTVGGHSASLRPAALFEIIPAIDSIVRFEGEHILLDLVNHLHAGSDWKKAMGISYMHNGALINNQLRSLEPDLDLFPYPTRSEIKEYVLGKKYATLLAGRGCTYNCIFCNTRQFYRQPPGPMKRIRNPVKVVEEMEYLYHEKECSIFLFEDDDFPVITHNKSTWINDFCAALRIRDLSGKIMWKINCRPDEVDPDSFEMMRQHGLFSVFLGIEDGTDAGLLHMKKSLGVSDNFRSVKILKNLGISIDFGFMLFQPFTTHDSLLQNIQFLELICADGYMPVTFLKMLPYLETEIKVELMKEGRLKGKPGFLNYDFYDRTLNDYYNFISDLFNSWLNGSGGLLNISKWASIYISVFLFYHGNHERIESLSDELKLHISESNKFMIASLKELSLKFESGNYNLKNDAVLDNYRTSIEKKHNTVLGDVTRIIEKLEFYHLTKGLFIG